MACTRTTVVVLGLLLAVAAGIAATIVFMPQVREAFSHPPRGASVLLVHATWCGHCKRLLAAGGPWAGLKAALPGVRFAELSEASADGKRAVERYGVRGFPDIRVIAGDGETVAVHDGERTVPAMAAWVTAHIGTKSA